MLAHPLRSLHIPRHYRCYHFLSRVEGLAFSDFRLIGPFVEACSTAVKATQCGSLSMGNAFPALPKDAGAHVEHYHSQGGTLECLIEALIAENADTNNMNQQPSAIDERCRHQIMRLAELSVSRIYDDGRISYRYGPYYYVRYL